MKKIETISKVHLVLENCEVLSIAGRFLKDLYVGGVTHTYRSTHNYMWSSNDVCSEAYLEFDDPVIENLDPRAKKDQRKRLLEFDDVTAIVIYDENDEKLLDVYVPYEEEEPNDHQMVTGKNVLQTTTVTGKKILLEWRAPS